MVDRENGLIKNVCLLSEQSKNGYRYPVAAQAKAIPFVNGSSSYFDHYNFRDKTKKPHQRSPLEWAAKVINPRMDGNRMRGDLRVGKGPNGQQLMDIAECSPEGIGMSMVADWWYDEKTKTALECVKVHSVDVVGGPATTRTMQESILENDLELIEKLKGILQAGGQPVGVLKQLAEACEVTLDESKLDQPKTLSEQELADIESDRVELQKFRKEKLAAKAIADHGKNKVKATPDLLKTLSEQADEAAMASVVKVLAEQIGSGATVKSGLRQADDADKASQDWLKNAKGK